MKYELVAFDMDGTLTKGNGCWVKVHRHFGTLSRGDENLRAWEAGMMDYEEFMRRDIRAWLSIQARIHISTIEGIFSGCQLVDNAASTISELKKRGCITVIITSGIDILAERIAEELGIDYVRANGLAIDGEGYLIGEGILGVDPICKDNILRELSTDLKIPIEKTIAVGDSKYDRNFLKGAGLGVAYIGDEGLRREADVVIQDLRELLNYME